MRDKLGAVAVILIVVGFGLLVFIILFGMLGNTIANAFKSYRNSENTQDRLVAAFENISSDSVSVGTVKLLQTVIDSDSMYIGFNANKNFTFSYAQGDSSSGLGKYYFNHTIKRPFECDGEKLGKTCICLCKGQNVEVTLKKEYGAGYIGDYDYVDELKCDDLECKYEEPDKVKFKDITKITSVLDKPQYLLMNYENDYWADGFILMKETKTPPSQISLRSSGIYSYTDFQTKYTDILIVKNSDGLSICFKDECKAS